MQRQNDKSTELEGVIDRQQYEEYYCHHLRASARRWRIALRYRTDTVLIRDTGFPAVRSCRDNCNAITIAGGLGWSNQTMYLTTAASLCAFSEPVKHRSHTCVPLTEGTR